MGTARQLKVTYLKTGKSQNISLTFSSLAEEMYMDLMRDSNVKVEILFPARSAAGKKVQERKNDKNRNHQEDTRVN